MTTEPYQFIRDYLEREGEISMDKDEFLSCRYLEMGLISSFDIINFILEMEEAYHINFTPEDIQSDAFRTIDGLIHMIKSKVDALSKCNRSLPPSRGE